MWRNLFKKKSKYMCVYVYGGTERGQGGMGRERRGKRGWGREGMQANVTKC